MPPSAQRARAAPSCGRLAGLETVGNGHCRRIWRSSLRDFCACQRSVRIDLEGDGDQREDENDGQGSHGRFCHARLRPNRSDISAKRGSSYREGQRRRKGIRARRLRSLPRGSIVIPQSEVARRPMRCFRIGLGAAPVAFERLRGIAIMTRMLAHRRSNFMAQNRHRHWTPEEDSRFRELASRTSFFDIAIELGRDLAAVKARAQQLRLAPERVPSCASASQKCARHRPAKQAIMDRARGSRAQGVVED
jgi:hypothetical protein